MRGDRSGVQILAERGIWESDIKLLIFETIEGVSKSVVEPLAFKKVVEQGTVIEPTVRLDDGAAQQLMNELWKIGVRPTNGEGSVGQIGATERHLEDMRRLVFNGEDKT